uniref:Uncharacterized protein n=1 Tax=Siphoviridae sp. ctb1k4 TaxID=2826391 RepID=A0A8S5MTT7_9CAUD|nr:MAG TPA: hypothetical protein [Siphoviridae sp. ctb1k4]
MIRISGRYDCPVSVRALKRSKEAVSRRRQRGQPARPAGGEIPV